MTISFMCPSCNSSLHAPDDYGGGKARCQTCGTPVRIPKHEKISVTPGPSNALMAPEVHPAATLPPATAERTFIAAGIDVMRSTFDLFRGRTTLRSLRRRLRAAYHSIGEASHRQGIVCDSIDRALEQVKDADVLVTRSTNERRCAVGFKRKSRAVVEMAKAKIRQKRANSVLKAANCIFGEQLTRSSNPIGILGQEIGEAREVRQLVSQNEQEILQRSQELRRNRKGLVALGGAMVIIATGIVIPVLIAHSDDREQSSRAQQALARSNAREESRERMRKYLPECSPGQFQYASWEEWTKECANIAGIGFELDDRGISNEMGLFVVMLFYPLERV